MSTAEPMHNGSNGNYYSVFQQGAGLANVSAVLRTPLPDGRQVQPTASLGSR